MNRFILIPAVFLLVTPLALCMGDSLPDLLERRIPAVVSVRAELPAMPGRGELRGVEVPKPFPMLVIRGGTGFLIEGEGVIATSGALLENARRVEVIFADGRRAPAKPMGAERMADLALLKVDPRAVKGIEPLPLSDRPPKVGQTVIALGSLMELGISAFRGIVSGLDRELDSGPASLIQTDIIAPPEGMAGGPLIGEDGGVVGMCWAVRLMKSAGRSPGLLFAVPSDLINRAISVIRDEIGWGYLGATLSPSREGPGVEVKEVIPGSPARKAGFEEGDIILELNGELVLNLVQLRRRILTARPGEEVEFKILREGRELILRARIGESKR